MKTLTIIFVCLLLAASVQITTINIPVDRPTIQAGIDAAIKGETVLVKPGTYVALLLKTQKKWFQSLEMLSSVLIMVNLDDVEYAARMLRLIGKN